jgi:hypothetical protein
MTIIPSHSVDVGIGDLWVRLHTTSAEFAATMAERFTGFLGHVETPDYEFTITLVPPAPEERQEDDVHVWREGALWRMTRNDFTASWDPLARHGQAEMLLSPYSLDSLLRIVHTIMLAQEGSMLMHASSAIRDGRAYVFTGVSGAGKTTISRLAPTDVHLLTDEMSFIRRTTSGYLAYGTPFAGELARPGENIHAPLAGIFLLVQGPENRIDTLTPQEAVRGLMGNILFFAKDPQLSAAVFDAAITLACTVPVQRLTFLPDQRVWDLIGNTQ